MYFHTVERNSLLLAAGVSVSGLLLLITIVTTVVLVAVVAVRRRKKPQSHIYI